MRKRGEKWEEKGAKSVCKEYGKESPVKTETQQSFAATWAIFIKHTQTHVQKKEKKDTQIGQFWATAKQIRDIWVNSTHTDAQQTLLMKALRLFTP